MKGQPRSLLCLSSLTRTEGHSCTNFRPGNGTQRRDKLHKISHGRMTGWQLNQLQGRGSQPKKGRRPQLQQEGMQLAEENSGIHLVNLVAVEKESKDS